MPVLENYIPKYHDYTNRYYKMMLKMYDFYVKLYGTKVVVNRLVRTPINDNKIDKDQVYNQVYGKVASNDEKLYNENNKVFSTMIIINQASLRDYYNKNADSIVVYINKNELDLGDNISYNRYGRNLSFKVIESQCYEDYLYSYTLLGIKDGINTE